MQSLTTSLYTSLYQPHLLARVDTNRLIGNSPEREDVLGAICVSCENATSIRLTTANLKELITKNTTVLNQKLTNSEVLSAILQLSINKSTNGMA
jgi:hypothetical protein